MKLFSLIVASAYSYEYTTEKPFDPNDRLDVIQYHFDRLAASLPDANWADRYVARFNKAAGKARDSGIGESCYEENGFPKEDTADDVQVFDETDFCKLNGQVNAALNSWARNYACDGRGKVYRQVIRSARKAKKFYSDKMGC
ncbi:Oidioi.mRNA.OKI2018_I69.chr2.g4460.t1.cds [Oikopleura dioica]|uniref:Oidioi.mRNA.OKI2018_I69.chr2.g4460.t1.cds n=1 Tax=Oikopleura dioica TaxID=34765 RepID=A0ABN7T6H9_OIKDI|nr:Oidioi.mRNA.OKI2018_I69.chr2.g4460.t1.cds [Oikopleura dioica]